MVIQRFHGAIPKTTLAADINAAVTSLTLASGTGWNMATPFVVTIERGTANEERIRVGTVTGATLSALTRGYDSTVARAHTAGSTCYIEHTLDATFMAKVASLVDVGATKGDLAVWNGTAWSVVPAPVNGRALVADSAQATGWSSSAMAFLAAAAGTGSVPAGSGGTYQELALPADKVQWAMLSSAAGAAVWKASPAVLGDSGNIATALTGTAFSAGTGHLLLDTTNAAMYHNTLGVKKEIMGWPKPAAAIHSAITALNGTLNTVVTWNVVSTLAASSNRLNPGAGYWSLAGQEGFYLFTFDCGLNFGSSLSFVVEEASSSGGPWTSIGTFSLPVGITNPHSTHLVHLNSAFMRALIKGGSDASNTIQIVNPRMAVFRLPGNKAW